MSGYLAIDPGLTTGWALFDDHGTLEDSGQVRGLDQFYRWLTRSCPVPDLVICEDFILNPNVPQGGSNMIASQVIGVVRAYALEHGLILVMQPSRILKIGYAYAAMRPLPKSRHSESHEFDAMAHGVYYLCKHKIRKIILEELPPSIGAD